MKTYKFKTGDIVKVKDILDVGPLWRDKIVRVVAMLAEGADRYHIRIVDNKGFEQGYGADAPEEFLERINLSAD